MRGMNECSLQPLHFPKQHRSILRMLFWAEEEQKADADRLPSYINMRQERFIYVCEWYMIHNVKPTQQGWIRERAQICAWKCGCDLRCRNKAEEEKIHGKKKTNDLLPIIYRISIAFYCIAFHCVYCTAHALGQCLLTVCIGISFLRDSVSVAEMLLWDFQNLIVSPASTTNKITLALIVLGWNQRA